MTSPPGTGTGLPHAGLGEARELDAPRAQALHAPVVALERERLELPLALAALLVRRVGAQQERPLGPRRLRTALARRRRAVRDLDHRRAALAQHVAEAVRARVAAAEDRDAQAASRSARVPSRAGPATRRFCCTRYSMARCTPASSAPGSVSARCRWAPVASTSASWRARSSSSGTSRADGDAERELDALGDELLDPAVDQLLLELEVGDAVAQQPARRGRRARTPSPRGPRARAAARRRGRPAPSRHADGAARAQRRPAAA